MRHRCHCRCHCTVDEESATTGPLPLATHGSTRADAAEGVPIDDPMAIVEACTACARAHLATLFDAPPKPKPPITPWVDEDGA